MRPPLVPQTGTVPPTTATAVARSLTVITLGATVNVLTVSMTAIVRITIVRPMKSHTVPIITVNAPNMDGGVRGLTGRDVPRPVGRGSFLGTVPVQITFVADTLERPVLVTELHVLSSTPYGVDGAPGRHAAPHVEQGLTFGHELVMGCTLARAIPRNRGPVKTVFVVR